MESTGIVIEISEDRKSALIVPDKGGDPIAYKGKELKPNIDVYDGVSFVFVDGNITDVSLITTVKTEGEILREERELIRQLTVLINQRMGGTKRPPGGCVVKIKTRDF